ncbi:hypothetical protein [Aeromonas media]|uniref:hypothetical protein n=1 Tax=Aeromonas media TaxID=651 RepID=UPI000F92CD0E|nr:hypothetical protein [Aeromonas media]
MALFFLNYDLRKQRNYQPLYDELATFGAVRILESMWCFNRINTNSASLRDHFQKFVDADDGICVSEVADWASFKVQNSPNKLK